MTKHTFFKASDGTFFIPEPYTDNIIFCLDNSKAFNQCIEYEEQLRNNKQNT